MWHQSFILVGAVGIGAGADAVAIAIAVTVASMPPTNSTPIVYDFVHIAYRWARRRTLISVKKIKTELKRRLLSNKQIAAFSTFDRHLHGGRAEGLLENLCNNLLDNI